MDQQAHIPRRRPLWRRAALFVLETNPPWWGRAGLWVALGLFLMLTGLLLWSLMSTTMRTIHYPFTYARQADGSWKFNAKGPGPCLIFLTDGIYSEIPGSRRCDAWLNLYVEGGGTLASVGLTLDEAKALRKRGSQHLLDELSRRASTDADLRMAKAVLGMIIRGKRQESSGILSWIRPGCIGLGLAILIPAGILGNLRYYLRRGYQTRLELGTRGICPRCEYALTGLSDDAVCPECGLDVQRDIRESREGSGNAPDVLRGP